MSDIEFVKPFGPSILEMNCNSNSIQKMNEFIDNMSLSDKRLRSSHYDNEDNKKIPDLLERGFEIIYLKNEDLFNTNISEDILLGCSEYLNFIGEKPNKAFLANSSFSDEFVDAWVNNYDENSTTPPHRHRGFLSGIIILNLPETYSTNCLQFIWNNEIYNPEEKVGKLLLFPNFMIHWVRKQHVKGRRTLSFNIFLG